MNAGMTWNRVDRFARSFHGRATVHLLRGVLVVRTAEQADPVRSVEMRSREPVLVIELQGASLRAPAAALVGERAAAIVALEDLALDRIGNVTSLVHVTFPMRSSARSSSATMAAARSPTSAAAGARRLAPCNSITRTGSRERISTERTGSACSAVR